jgi:hypothetical protein
MLFRKAYKMRNSKGDENMKQVYPELVIEAYRATGLKPMRGDFFPKEGCACALGAVYQFMCEDGRYVEDYLEQELTDNYVQSFAAGFDGIKRDNSLYAQNYPNAYEDGVKAWEIVQEKLL